MVPIKGEWTPFLDLEDKLAHFRLWGLIPEKSKQLRPIMVTDGYFGTPEPCSIVGHRLHSWAVIELADGYHAIHGDYLAEMQPDAKQKLPRGKCFAEILQSYVVVDIETTGYDHHNDRIIEIAAAKYEYGKKVDQFQSLVNPGMLIPNNIVTLTGITQEDLNFAPPLDNIASDFLAFISGLPIIGHNALSFDIPFLSAQIAPLDNPVVDTLPLARKTFDLLPSHALEYLKDTLSLSTLASHRALADVETTNNLLWACLSPRKYEQQVMSAYLKNRNHIHTLPQSKGPARKQPTKRVYEHVDIKAIVATEDIDEACALFGKIIVFTGTLSLPREQAMQMAVNAGAILRTSVSRKTDYLVVGAQDNALVGADGKSSKEEDAEMLNQTGKATIKVINEGEFISLVNSKVETEPMEQLNIFSAEATEQWVYDIMREYLLPVVRNNNANINSLAYKDQKSYSSVWFASQLAFRICCRKGHHYFGVSNAYIGCADESCMSRTTKDGASEGFTNFDFQPTAEGILIFKDFLCAVLDKTIDAAPKEFDCCSRYNECSDAGVCIHPNPDLAAACGYRKIMKQGRIFYGKNRNVD